VARIPSLRHSALAALSALACCSAIAQPDGVRKQAPPGAGIFSTFDD
jgi:hypothetical protein